MNLLHSHSAITACSLRFAAARARVVDPSASNPMDVYRPFPRGSFIA
jgi:hypothetical protein